MRRESVQEILERVSTPLVPMGGEAPKILDVPENVTVVESMQIHHWQQNNDFQTRPQF